MEKFKLKDKPLNIKNDVIDKVQIIKYSILIGIITGSVISINRILISKLSNVFKNMYLIGSQNYIYIPLIFIMLVTISLYISRQVNKYLQIQGSGVIHVENVLSNKLSTKWLEVLVNKFIAILICSSLGLSVGTCGPSIQIGACIGGYISSKVEKLKHYEKYLIKSGISAGMSAVFNTPLSAVVFTIEKMVKNKSILTIIAIIISSYTAYITSKYIFRLDYIVKLNVNNTLDNKYYLLIILLSIIVGISGMILNKSVSYFQFIFEKVSINSKFKVMIPFILSGIIGLKIPVLLGGGSYILKEIQPTNLDIQVLILATFIKYILTIICFSTLVPGGMFFPTLTIGAMMGNIVGIIGVIYFKMPNEYIMLFTVVAMAGHFVSVLKIPLTSIVLVLELTGSINYIVPVLVGVTISNIVSSINIDYKIFRKYSTNYKKIKG